MHATGLYLFRNFRKIIMTLLLLWDMSHLFVCFVALVIQGGAVAKFWPLHHYNQCMGEDRRKTLSTAHGRGGVSTRYFHQIQVGM